MVPILRSITSRSVVRRRSFSTAAPTNTNRTSFSFTLSALKEKFSVPWYIGPLAGLGVGYGLGMIILGDLPAEGRSAKETEGDSWGVCGIRRSKGEDVDWGIEPECCMGYVFF